MTPKPKLLLISAVPPWPQTSGGATRIHYTLKYLSRKYELYFLTFGEPPCDKPAQEFLAKTCRWWTFLPLTKRSFLTKVPRFFSCWYSQNLIKLIRTLVKRHHIKRVRVEFTPLLYLNDVFSELPVLTTFVAHDISTVTFKRRLTSAEDFRSKIIGFFNYWSIKRYEEKYLPRFDEVVAVSKTDEEILRQKFQAAVSRVEPNGIEKIAFSQHLSDRTAFSLGFIGGSLHPPNCQALQLLTTEILPLLNQKIACRLVIAGADNQKWQGTNILNLGVVNDTAVFWQQIDVLAAPLLAGSGSRVKILESLAHGVPVITTKIGAEGLMIENDFLRVVAGIKAEDTVAAIVQACQDLARHQPSETARVQLKVILQDYLWAKSFTEA